MPLAKREWSSSLWRHGLGAVGLGLLLGFLGPFGTNPAFGRIERYTFWLGLGLAGYAGGLIAWRILETSPRFEPWGVAKRAVLAGSVSALPQTFVVFWAMSLLQPGRTASLLKLPLLYLAVAAVQMILLTAIVLIEQSAPSLQHESEEPEPPREGLAKWQPIALEAQDHYVRVHTIEGSRLVLQRLSDAIAEVSSVEGLQIHRGWWVASAAVTGTFVEDGRRWVRLVNGLAIPVSRARRREVLAQKWPRLQGAPETQA